MSEQKIRAILDGVFMAGVEAGRESDRDATGLSRIQVSTCDLALRGIVTAANQWKPFPDPDLPEDVEMEFWIVPPAENVEDGWPQIGIYDSIDRGVFDVDSQEEIEEDILFYRKIVPPKPGIALAEGE